MIREGYYEMPLLADLKVSGEDAATFLQSQFSQDVRGGVGRSVFGLWLDYRGKILGESTLLRVGDSAFEVISPYTEGMVLAEHMDAHIIADEVEVERSMERVGLLLFPPKNGFEGVEIEEGSWGEWQGGRLFRWGRKLENGWLWVGAIAEEAALRKQLVGQGYRSLSRERVESARLSACFPKIPEEIGDGETPGDAGLIESCSLNKGCYLGQEVVARMERLGRVRKRLVSVRVEGAELEKGDLLYLGEKKVGEVRGWLQTRAGGQGLALMKVLDGEGESKGVLKDERGRKVQVETR